MSSVHATQWTHKPPSDQLLHPGYGWGREAADWGVGERSSIHKHHNSLTDRLTNTDRNLGHSYMRGPRFEAEQKIHYTLLFETLNV